MREHKAVSETVETPIPENGENKQETTPPDDQQEPLNQTRASRLPPQANAWLILLFHLAVCVAIALSIALAVDGYHALDDDSATHARYIDGTLVLRVGDVTTLISAAMVIVKLLVGAWTTLTVWACGHYLLTKAVTTTAPTETDADERQQDLAINEAKQVGWMIRWKLPPWLRLRSRLPQTPRQWIISATLLILTVQAFIAPIITGAVNWTSTSIAAPDETLSVPAVEGNTDFGGWYWFNYPYEDTSLTKKPRLRMAAGYASLMWGDARSKAPNGTSLTGNGCRHIVPARQGLDQNATLQDAVLPCVRIDSIQWHKAGEEVPRVEWVYVADSSSLSIVDDPPSSYYYPGVTVIFDTVEGREDPETTDVKPQATVFSKTQIVGIMVKRTEVQDPHCSQLDPTIFGSVDHLDRYKLSWGDGTNENCYFVGNITFTAGVTRSENSKYISSQVVEDQTPLDEVVFTADPWVQEAIWLLPDLMTMITLMNSTSLPTHDNIDLYVESLVRQAYLAAWDMYHYSFDSDQKETTYTAIPAIPRQLARVSYSRVFAWLGICCLMSVSGAVLLTGVLGAEDLKPPEAELLEEREARHEERTDGLLNAAFGLFT
ncbi:hypothetical protein BDV06DRAFT_184077 [Aspergillus oleicola]